MKLHRTAAMLPRNQGLNAALIYWNKRHEKETRVINNIGFQPWKQLSS